MEGAPVVAEFKPDKIGMEKLATMHEFTQNENKNIMIWDKNGQADSFFAYQATLVDLHKLIKNVDDKVKTKEEALEECRKSLVAAMRTGKLLVLNVGEYLPDLINDYTSDETNFPTAAIFQRDLWKVHETYIKTVRPDENMNDMGNPGAFFQDEKFGVCILARFKDLDTCKALCEKVPNSDSFHKFFVR